MTTDIQHGLTADDVARCGFGMARIVLRWRENPSSFIWRCNDLGIKVLGVWTWESLAPDADNGASAAQWAEWFEQEGLWSRIQYIQIENEVDLHGWEQSTYNYLVSEVAPHFREHCTIVSAGLAGGHASWLNGVNTSLLDLIAVHPYGRAPRKALKWDRVLPDWSTPVEEFLLPYLAFGRPLCVTEYGGTSKELRALWRDYYTEMTIAMRRLIADGIITFASLYGHSDLMVPGMGMLDTDGKLTEAGRGVRSVIGV